MTAPQRPATSIHDLLELPADADRKSVEKAYRQLARLLHPDKNPDADAATRLAAVNAAFTEYLNELKNPVRSGAPSHTGSAAAAGLLPTGLRVSVYPSPNPMRGPSVHATIHLEAAAPAAFEQTVTATHLIPCPACKGTGGANGSAVDQCAPCEGLGMGARGEACPACLGVGTQPHLRCPNCTGQRQVTYTHQVAVPVPAAAGAGGATRHSFPQAGFPSARGGMPGDLVLDVTSPSTAPAVSPTGPGQSAPAPPEAREVPGDTTEAFVRFGGGVGLVLDLTYGEMRAGVTLDIPSPSGGTALAVPAGTAPDTVLVVAGHGDPGADGNRGPLHVKCQLRWVGAAGDEETTLLRALDAEEKRRHPGLRAALGKPQGS